MTYLSFGGAPGALERYQFIWFYRYLLNVDIFRLIKKMLKNEVFQDLFEFVEEKFFLASKESPEMENDTKKNQHEFAIYISIKIFYDKTGITWVKNGEMASKNQLQGVHL